MKDKEEIQKIEEIEESRSNNFNLSKSQKISVILLAFFAFILIIGWGWQLKKNINSPFTPRLTENSSNKSPAEVQKFCRDGNCFSNQDELFKNSDTDKDGLNDFDELYIYKTSPYLEDSDSDGYSDKSELDSGNDPNCPVGRECATSFTDLINEPLVDTEKNGLDGLELIPGAGGLINNGVSADQDVLSGKSDAQTLRQMLLDAGMDKAILDQISDENLLKSYQEVLNK